MSHRRKKRRPPPPNMGAGPTLRSALRNLIFRLRSNVSFGTLSNLLSLVSRAAELLAELGASDIRMVRDKHLMLVGGRLAEEIGAGLIGVGHAHNIISACNTALEEAWGRSKVWVKPSKAIGLSRTGIRSEPVICDRDAVVSIAADLQSAGHIHAAVVLLLAIDYGLRLRECLLLRPTEVAADLVVSQTIRVRHGSKNGSAKYTERYLSPSLDPAALDLLSWVCSTQGTPNLIPGDRMLVDIYRQVERLALPRLKEVGIDRIHDLRAGHACDQFFALTGTEAPVAVRRSLSAVAPVESHVSVNTALQAISILLGHNRPRATKSYCGRV